LLKTSYINKFMQLFRKQKRRKICTTNFTNDLSFSIKIFLDI